MKRCNNCKIKINGYLKNCPLCGTELIGISSENVFPSINMKRDSILKKILLLVSLTIGLISLFVELYATRKLFISKFIIFGLITNYVLIYFIILKNYKNMFKMINKYFLVIFILIIIWYFITRSLIITTYFIPILCIIVYVFNSLTLLIYKNAYLKYTRTILLNSVIGLVPLLLIYLKLTTNDLISYISVLINIIVVLGLLIFCKDNVIEELKRTFKF